MKKLVLVRGPSGTGKSSIARHLECRHMLRSSDGNRPAACHETDQFFTDERGVYHFDATMLKTAHQWNEFQVERSMLHELPLVIVANTFTKPWEMNRYLGLAEDYKYEVEIIKTPGPWDADTLFQRNAHSVPLEVIKRHINGYQPHDNEVEWTELSIFNGS